MQDPNTTSASASSSRVSARDSSSVTSPTSVPLLSCRGLGRRFGERQAVLGLALRASRGEVIGLLGPNGAGKTTSLRMLAGTLAATQGELDLAGEAFDGRASQRQLNRLKRRIGYLPEGAPLWPHLTVRETLKCVAGLHGLSRKVRNDRLSALMDRLDITSFANHSCATLSKGYRRRVALAMALMHDPDILLLDEPTDGLDPLQKDSVRAFIRELGRERLIIVSTHLLEEVPRICDRVLVMVDGQLGFDDTPAALASLSLMPGKPQGTRLDARSRHADEPDVVIWRLTLDRALQGAELAGMSRLPGVANVVPQLTNDSIANTASAHGAQLQVTARTGQDPRPALARWCAQMGLKLEECVRERGDIEVAFRRLVNHMAQPSFSAQASISRRPCQQVTS